MSDAVPMWTREQALWVVENLEPVVAAVGAHVALAGSVLYRGHSDKDLDIVLYPHTSDAGMLFDWRPVKMVLKDFFKAGKLYECKGISQIRDSKCVSWLITPKGKRVDFFFLQ